MCEMLFDCKMSTFSLAMQDLDRVTAEEASLRSECRNYERDMAFIRHDLMEVRLALMVDWGWFLIGVVGWKVDCWWVLITDWGWWLELLVDRSYWLTSRVIGWRVDCWLGLMSHRGWCLIGVDYWLGLMVDRNWCLKSWLLTGWLLIADWGRYNFVGLIVDWGWYLIEINYWLGLIFDDWCWLLIGVECCVSDAEKAAIGIGESRQHGTEVERSRATVGVRKTHQTWRGQQYGKIKRTSERFGETCTYSSNWSKVNPRDYYTSIRQRWVIIQ